MPQALVFPAHQIVVGAMREGNSCMVSAVAVCRFRVESGRDVCCAPNWLSWENWPGGL